MDAAEECPTHQRVGSELGNTRRVTRAVFKAIAWCTIGVAVLAAVVLFGLARFGSARAGFEYLAGKRLIIVPQIYTYVNENKYPKDEFTFTIYNETRKPVTILGSSHTSCACTLLEGIHVTIPPSGSTAVSAKVLGVKLDRISSVDLTILTDCPEIPLLSATILFKKSNRESKRHQ